MIYLANPSTSSVRAMMERGSLGFMATPKQGNRLPAGVRWAADSGVFTARGREGFTVDGYLAWLERMRWAAADCLFATAPDVVGDAAATRAASEPVLPRIRALGLPAALVAQDGLVAPEWDAFDVLFIGGTTDWKLGLDARRLILEARRRGVWVHMGRVNTRDRLTTASLVGCDSVDGSMLAWGPDVNLTRLLRWLERKPGPFLPLEWSA